MKPKFSRGKLIVVIMHGPSERDDEEKEKFKNEFVRVLSGVGNGYKLYVMGDL